MSNARLNFQLIFIEKGVPIAFWNGQGSRDGSTHISVQISDDVNILALCEVLLGLAVELLPDPIKPKGMVTREILKEYISADNEKDVPW